MKDQTKEIRTVTDRDRVRLQNACHRLNKDAHRRESKINEAIRAAGEEPIDQFIPCAKFVFLVQALRNRTTYTHAVNAALHTFCDCHPDLTRDQMLDFLSDPSYRLAHHYPLKGGQHRTGDDKLILIIEKGDIIGRFGTQGTRGRELAERILTANGKAYATYQGEVIPWVTGRKGDRFIDSDVLPDRCRMPKGYR